MRFISLVLAGLLAFVACAKKAPTQPVAPFVGVHGDAVSIATVSTDPQQSIIKYIFDFGNGTAETTGFLPSGETAWCCLALPDTGSYAIRAVARNVNGRESPWSEALDYHLTTPPEYGDTMVGWGPDDWSWFIRPWGRDRWYRFGMSVGDPDGDSVAVQFIWGDGRTSQWSPFMPSGSIVRDSVQYATDGDYYVRIVLKDIHGSISTPDTIAGLRVSEIAVLWYSDEAGGDASPTLGEHAGVVRTFVTDEYLGCLDGAGSVVWLTDVGGADVYAPVLSAAGTRLYIARVGGIACVDALTGDVLWQVDIDDNMCQPAIGPQGDVYVGLEHGLACVTDLGDSGAVAWYHGNDDWSNATGIAVGFDSTVFCVILSDYIARPSRVIALRPGGELEWCDSVTMVYADCPPAIDADGRLLAVDDDLGKLCCFNPDGVLAWQADVGPSAQDGNGPVVGPGGRIYVSCDETRCFDASGNWWWTNAANSEANAPCVASDGSLFVGDNEGQLFCTSPSGETRWVYSVYDTLNRYWGYRARRARRDDGELFASPVIGPDGNLYFYDDAMICLSLGKRTLADSPWPAYGHDAARSGWAGRR